MDGAVRLCCGPFYELRYNEQYYEHIPHSLRKTENGL